MFSDEGARLGAVIDAWLTIERRLKKWLIRLN
jgi:hypothetical protein